MKIEPFVVNLPFIISFEHLGPSLGWGVEINGFRYIRFSKKQGEWEASYHKLPEWITMAEICLLKEVLEQSIRQLAQNELNVKK